MELEIHVPKSQFPLPRIFLEPLSLCDVTPPYISNALAKGSWISFWHCFVDLLYSETPFYTPLDILVITSQLLVRLHLLYETSTVKLLARHIAQC
jgi:hypothetical protein